MIDDLIPYALTTKENASFLNFDGIEDCKIIDVADRDNRIFCEILNHANQLAFGGPSSMGMPKWVMLDCAILGSAMIGFAIEADKVDLELKTRLVVPVDYRGLVPISEYSASFTARPKCVSGFSLQTQIEKKGVGTRTKALGLAVLDATRQIGVTQFDSTAIGTHTRFGALKLEIHRPIVHTYPERSFVYSVDLPNREALIEMSNGKAFIPESTTSNFSFDISNSKHHDKLGAHLSAGLDVWILGLQDGNISMYFGS